MSNRIYNKQTANCRTGSTAKIGSYGRGQNDAPKAVEAGAITTKGIPITLLVASNKIKIPVEPIINSIGIL